MSNYNSCCPCDSGKLISKCCRSSLNEIKIKIDTNSTETYLLDWIDKYSIPISDSFDKKARTFSYRISQYLDAVLDLYLDRGYPSKIRVKGDTDELYYFQKHNISLTIAAAYRLLAEGLFVQSGVLLRTALESSMVLLDTAINPKSIDEIINNKYQSKSILKRAKPELPPAIIRWYGYFSANFTHVAALHLAPYIPRACYSDNWVIVTGLQNILRTIVSYHIVLEKAYLPDVVDPWFWETSNNAIAFNDSSKIFEWADSLGTEVITQLPIKDIPPGVRQSNRSVNLKV